MKTLLYLASGGYHPEYDTLPFDRMIFVDRSESYGKSYPKNDHRIRFINEDALIAVDILKKEGAKIDCLVSVNEGLYEGGGTYPVFSGFLMGYLSPLLKDEFTLVCNLNYYTSELKTPMSKLDWGFIKNKILQDDAGYINPSFFSESQRLSPQQDYGHVFLMKKDYSESIFNLSNATTTVKVIHGSIWDDEDQLDVIGLILLSKQSLQGRCRNTINSVDTFFKANPKVLDLYGKTFEEILNYCKTNGYTRIGLTPWLNDNYQEVIQYLKDLNDDFFCSITFYHLNNKDFKSIREFLSK